MLSVRPLAVGERQPAAVLDRDHPRDGQSEADAARRAIARWFDADEGIKHRLELVLRESRTPVGNLDQRRATLSPQFDLGRTAEGDRIVDEILEKPLQRNRVAVDRCRSPS